MKKAFLFSFLIFPLLLKANDSITVYLFISEDCPICQYYTIELNQLYDDFKGEIGFMGLFPNRSSTERKISEFKEKYKLKFPLKREYHQKTSKGFGVKITPEVVVFNEDKKEVLYQGRIDDTWARLGRRRPQPTQTELKDVLVSIKSKTPVTTSNTNAVGCYITYFN